MTEDEARAWLTAQFSVPRETWAQLEAYIALLFDEMERQNLIAESTKAHVWARHIVDSAQLLHFAPEVQEGEWMDLGAGAGLPGIIVAIMSGWTVRMVESRRKRVDFLNHVIAELGLANASVAGSRLEMLDAGTPAAVISARAFAPLPRLLDGAARFADNRTIWLLPKGRNWENELASIRPTWQGAFHVEQSATDPDSAIMIGRSVHRVQKPTKVSGKKGGSR